MFASAARYEPFGLAVLEAAQSGLALVLADRPGFRELWDGAALFADPADPDAFTAAMRQALDSPEPWGWRAASRAARYPAAAMVEATAALHRGLGRGAASGLGASTLRRAGRMAGADAGRATAPAGTE